jgi:hypothetical protein
VITIDLNTGTVVQIEHGFIAGHLGTARLSFTLKLVVDCRLDGFAGSGADHFCGRLRGRGPRLPPLARKSSNEQQRNAL